ncbi:unnamed protein product [Coffea canephora]|uniref:Cytochrome b5 heme-binding domain-containing protein n=2 Tax=Coffea TaxID=13442 RepID=A0A068UHW8_COFCA|nr:cytochrome b5 domain-containing protein RLF-like [Coffea arabica]CDP07814.1 unnamed protein product [Coffea canephora]
MIANDDDFTFCQVGVNEDKDAIDAQEVVENISGLRIQDESVNDHDSGQASGILWNDKLPRTTASSKEERKGSLSFSVIDTSSSDKVNQHVSQSEDENAVSSAKASQGQKTATRKPAQRNKVPFEKGYSQMDWMRLTRMHPDLAGLNGQSNRRLVSLNEVKQHQNEDSMWTVLKGHVYNIAPYMKFHPGGVDMLVKAVGKDCTSLFNKYHPWVNAEFLLEKCLVGTLQDGH